MHDNASNSSASEATGNSSDLDCWEDLRKEYALAESINTYFYVTIAVVAGYLNIRLLQVTISSKDKRNRMLHSKIALLAVMDLLSLVTMMLENCDRWLLLLHMPVTSQPLSFIFCQLPTALYVAANCSSSWAASLIAVQRYAAVKFPYCAAQRCTSTRAAWAETAGLLLLPAALSVPKLFAVHNEELHSAVVLCMPTVLTRRFDVLYSAAMFCLATVLPVCTLLAASALLTAELNRLRSRERGLHASAWAAARRPGTQQFASGTHMILVLSGLYTLLQLPDSVMWVLSHHNVLQPGVNECKFVSSIVWGMYVELSRDMVAISNPAVFLCFKHFAKRKAARAALHTPLPSVASLVQPASLSHTCTHL